MTDEPQYLYKCNPNSPEELRTVRRVMAVISPTVLHGIETLVKGDTVAKYRLDAIMMRLAEELEAQRLELEERRKEHSKNIPEFEY